MYPESPKENTSNIDKQYKKCLQALQRSPSPTSRDRQEYTCQSIFLQNDHPNVQISNISSPIFSHQRWVAKNIASIVSVHHPEQPVKNQTSSMKNIVTIHQEVIHSSAFET
jgi:hypothetical protein